MGRCRAHAGITAVAARADVGPIWQWSNGEIEIVDDLRPADYRVVSPPAEQAVELILSHVITSIEDATAASTNAEEAEGEVRGEAGGKEKVDTARDNGGGAADAQSATSSEEHDLQSTTEPLHRHATSNMEQHRTASPT
jgi:hypothetical protein